MNGNNITSLVCDIHFQMTLNLKVHFNILHMNVLSNQLFNNIENKQLS